MIFVPPFKHTKNPRSRIIRGLLLATLVLPLTARALPARLVLALDGIAYRDLQALQAGFIHTNFWGQKIERRAFTAEEGYFPVSRMVSTFPSASDVAWTDIFGDRPLPGYQRTYFSQAVNAEISINGVTTTMEHERQMHYQLQNGLFRALGYLYPVHTCRLEIYNTLKYFWKAPDDVQTFYVYLRATDDAQHLDRDIFEILCELDQKLQKLRADYRAKTGRDLQIVILSDHGHNHAGRGRRVPVREFLKKAGYEVTKAINGQKDVVLPTVGIESWVEIHCAPSESEKLAQRLCRLEGAEIITATVSDATNRFLVLNAKGERALIHWNPDNNSFRYAAENGDPLNYQPVVEALARSRQLDADGFARADDWMAATLTHHYPLAPERIARGLTRAALNPATVIISLDNRYVNANWLTQQGSRLVTCRSTHGGLDDINSDGILLSNFMPTSDTSTDRVAGQFEDFAGVKNFRTEQNGAEWVTKREQALTRIARVSFDRDYQRLPDEGVYLRIWSPEFMRLDGKIPVEATIGKVIHFGNSPNQRQIVFDPLPSFADKSAGERIYQLPLGLKLEPQSEYKISCAVRERNKTVRLCAFNFYTNRDGQPAAY